MRSAEPSHRPERPRGDRPQENVTERVDHERGTDFVVPPILARVARIRGGEQQRISLANGVFAGLDGGLRLGRPVDALEGCLALLHEEHL